jgi:hypothetical protein
MDQASLLMKIPVDLKESIRAEAASLDMTMTAYLMFLHKKSRIERGNIQLPTKITCEGLAEDNKVMKKYVFWLRFRKRFKMAKKFTKEKILQSYKLMSGRDIVRAFIYTMGELDKFGEEDMWRYTSLKEELLKRVGD